MPTLIWSKVKDGLDPAMKKKAYAFFEKLQESDKTVGLHIEPLKGSVDPRVRTGRVDDNFRCVMFKIAVEPEPVYVIHGVWPHDKANAIGERVRLSMNPINGVPEVERVMDELVRAASTPPQRAAEATQVPAGPVESARPVETAEPVALPHTEASTVDQVTGESTPAWPDGLTPQLLHSSLGIDASLASTALAAPTEAALVDVIAAAPVEWQGAALLDLATGKSVDAVREDFALARVEVDPTANEDEQLIQGLRSEAAQSSFHWVDDNDELRRIIEAGDLGAWRLFLHPDQRAFVDRNFSGPARLAGGAGTGKTVVAVHRACRLVKDNPCARVLLTTYTRNLADDLAASVLRLEPELVLQTRLGEAGLHVKGIDALAWAVVQRAGDGIDSATSEVLGAARTSVLKQTPESAWQEAIETAGSDLPPELRTPSFFEAEYGLVILPNSITTSVQYNRVRRQGRGVALDRAKRQAVWGVVEAYRVAARAEGTTDFQEKAALAAAWLRGSTPLFDHVLVDEAQDLTPAHLMLLRAIVARGSNDLFLCEDSHQRIYGQKVTLSHYGIDIRGRARRLTLNYRTTAQNLQWAMNVLDGGDYTDMDGEAEEHRYHSARTGPRPVLLRAGSASDELAAIAELVRSWLPADSADEGRATVPEAIAILVHDRWKRETVVNGLAEHNLEVRSVDRGDLRPGRPVVMTMHRAKGLEFTHVLLLGGVREPRGYGFSSQDLVDAQLRERSLLYVAATRARDVLAVCS